MKKLIKLFIISDFVISPQKGLDFPYSRFSTDISPPPDRRAGLKRL